MKKKVLLGMSGGVDSSVAALLLKNAGYDVIGAYLFLCDSDKNEEEAEAAKAVADSLSIPFITEDMKERFKEKVIDKFIQVYENGGTPNPCLYCNREIKFGEFLSFADRLGCDCIATGHYARIEKDINGEFSLMRAISKEKDQSYVLYPIKKEYLSRILLPLGSLTKDEVRAIAEKNHLVNARKKESQDICFVPDGDYASKIAEITGKEYPDGDFIDKDGNILGRHKGIIHYTVGQRRGLSLSLPAPLYVAKKDPINNTVTLLPDKGLYTSSLSAAEMNILIDKNKLLALKDITAAVRYRGKEQEAKITELTDINGNMTAKIEFSSPQRAICPGQAVVLYRGDRVIGGGMII